VNTDYQYATYVVVINLLWSFCFVRFVEYENKQ